MKCPHCYTELPDTAKFCYMCKNPIGESNSETEKSPCPNCGAPLPKTAKECYVCKMKFDLGGTLKPAPIVEKASGFQSGDHTGSYNSFQPGYKPYTRLPQNTQTKNNKAKPIKAAQKSGSGCGTLLAILVVLLAIGYYYTRKNKDKDDEPASDVQVTEESKTTNNSSKTTTEVPVSPLDKKLASDMKKMKIGGIGKKGNVYLGLAYVKRSKEMHYLSYSDSTDSEHEILYFFVDIYNNSNEVKNISASDFSCYIDGNQVDHFDCSFLFTEDGISEYNSNEIDTGCAHLLGLDYEVPLDWSEAKLYYGSDCIWFVNNSEVSEEAYDGRKMINADFSYQNTPVNKMVYSGDYELVFDGFDYYQEENYFGDEYFAVFKFTVNAKSDVDLSLFGYNMRCYQNNYLIDGASYTLDDKVDDYINIYDVDEIHEGMSAKVYTAFEVNEKGGDFRMVFDDGYIYNNVVADIFVVGTDED